jgi:hypothetical protein
VIPVDEAPRRKPLERIDPRRPIFRNTDATRWVWITYGLAQAVITMMMAFDLIDTLTPAEVCTSVALILYVAVNELIERPRRARTRRDPPLDLDY